MHISLIVIIFLFSKSILNSLKGSFKIVPIVSWDSKLYKFNDGKPVGALLNKASYEEYDHYDITDLKGLSNPDKILIQSTYTTLEVLTNEDAVYQDFKLCKFLHGCVITWKSDNEDVITIDNLLQELKHQKKKQKLN